VLTTAAATITLGCGEVATSATAIEGVTVIVKNLVLTKTAARTTAATKATRGASYGVASGLLTTFAASARVLRSLILWRSHSQSKSA
jgi:hypothetical protein